VSLRGSSRLSPFPHLFNYFCSDFSCEAKVNELYADNFNLSESSPSVEVLSEKPTECLVGVSEWSSKNKLAIAPAKSSVTLFMPDRHESNVHPDVKYEGVLLPLAKEVKWFGTNVSKHFTPGPQIKDIRVKTSLCIQLMKAIYGQDWGDKETLTLTYNSLVKPVITNNAAAWFPSIDPNSD
jgi:hypothetical protein